MKSTTTKTNKENEGKKLITKAKNKNNQKRTKKRRVWSH